jgi:hypothetical protein
MADKTAWASPGSGKGKPPKPGLTDIIDDNVLPVDPEKFTPEQKQDFEAMMQQARDWYLSSYMQTRKGSLVQKYKLKLVADIPRTGSSKDGEVKRDPDGSAQPSVKGATEGSAGNQGDNLPEVHGTPNRVYQELPGANFTQDLQESFNNFQDRIDYAVHHALINQSGVLANTLSNMMKAIADGSIAEHQATGPVYLPGGVFPNYRTLITDAQPVVQAAPSVAPIAQPTASASTSVPAASATAAAQPMNPRLLVREYPQPAEQITNQPTQDQVAAMFLPPPVVNSVQQQPIQQAPPVQPTVQPVQQQVAPPVQPMVQPVQQQVAQPVQQASLPQQHFQPNQQTPPRQRLQPIQQTPVRHQPIQHLGSANASAGFTTPGGQLVQPFGNQATPEHLVHHI